MKRTEDSRRTGVTRRAVLKQTGSAIVMAGAASFAMPAVVRAETPGRKAINLTIHWIPRGDFGAYYLALQRGYYSQVGLDVTIHHVLGNASALQALSAGTAQFCHADITQMFQLQGKSPKPGMRSIALATDQTGTTIFFKKGRGIKTPKDLEGRTVLDSAGSTAKSLFTLVAKANGVDENKVIWKTAAANAKVALMLRDQGDGVATGLWAEVQIEPKLKPGELGEFPFGEWGANIEGDAAMTSDSFLADNKKLVKGFVQATVKGYKEGFADPKSAAAAIIARHPELDLKNTTKEFEITRRLALGSAQKQHGVCYQDPERMKATYDAVVNLLGQPISKPVTDLYTNEFL